jgi:beta-lactam-binding protein with PASTA domain
VVLYEMLTGEVPFTGSSAVEIAMKQVNEAPQPPSTKNRLITHGLEQVVMRALAKDPALRFHSAREMADELERTRRGLAVSQDTAQATAVIGAYEATQATSVMGAQPPAAPPPPQAKRSAVPWLLVALLLLASAVVGYVVYQQLQGSDQVTVPDVRGFTQQQAQTQLIQAGFTTAVEHKASKKVVKGQVIDTDPTHGSQVDKGSKVTIIVSKGPKSVTLPNLRGKSASQATQTIVGLGLPVPTQTPITSKLPVGQVVRTDPKAGVIPPDTVVTLFVSTGNVKVPNVVGMTCDGAKQALAASSLQGSCTNTPSDTVPAGQVISQSPGAGNQAPQGSTVSLQVSSGPSQVQVPDVTNMDYQTAKQTLQGDGLHAQRSRCLASDPTIPDGTVVGTDPPAGTMVDPKSDVTVFVADSTSTTPCP